MENLENKEIKVVNAVTRVNSKSNSSRITGKTIKIGALHFEREDGNFYHTQIDGVNYQVFHRFENNQLELDEHSSRRAKTIYIDDFDVIEETKNEVIYTISNGGEDIGFITQKQFDEFERLGKIKYYQDIKEYPTFWSEAQELYFSLTKQTNIDLNKL